MEGDAEIRHHSAATGLALDDRLHDLRLNEDELRGRWCWNPATW